MPDIGRYGLARRKRSAAEVDEKSERSVVAMIQGNRSRGTLRSEGSAGMWNRAEER